MTLPMLVNDVRGRTPKELAGVGVGRSTVRLPHEDVTLVGAGSPLFTLPAFGTGPVDVGLPYFAYDVTRYSSARIVVDMDDPAGAGELELEFHNGSAWVAAGALPIVASIAATPALRPEIGATKTLSVACIGDRRFRVVAKNGDNATIGTIRGLRVQFIDAGRRLAACNSTISDGAVVFEDFCAYPDMAALAAAYGYEATGSDPDTDWYAQIGDGARQFEGGAYWLYLESLSRVTLGQLSLAQVPYNGGHKALVVDIPAGEAPVGVQTTRWPSEWQIEGPTSVVVPRAEVTTRFNLAAMDDLAHDHAGSSRTTFEIAFLRMWGTGGITAGLRLLVGRPLGSTEPRLYAQRVTTPSGGSGLLEDLGAASDVVGAGDLKCSIVATVDEGVGVDFDAYLYSAGSGGVHAPVYSESVALLCDRFQTARALEAQCVTPAGEVAGAFKLTAIEIDYVPGSIIGGL